MTLLLIYIELMDVDLLNIDTTSIASLEELHSELESNGMKVSNPLQLCLILKKQTTNNKLFRTLLLNLVVECTHESLFMFGFCSWH